MGSGVTAVVFDAGDAYPSDARQACLRGVISYADYAGATRLVLERDDSPLAWDTRRLWEITGGVGCRDTLRYSHARASEELLLAIPMHRLVLGQGRGLAPPAYPSGHHRRRGRLISRRPTRSEQREARLTNRPDGCRAHFPTLCAPGGVILPCAEAQDEERARDPPGERQCTTRARAPLASAADTVSSTRMLVAPGGVGREDCQDRENVGGSEGLADDRQEHRDGARQARQGVRGAERYEAARASVVARPPVRVDRVPILRPASSRAPSTTSPAPTATAAQGTAPMMSRSPAASSSPATVNTAANPAEIAAPRRGHGPGEQSTAQEPYRPQPRGSRPGTLGARRTARVHLESAPAAKANAMVLDTAR